jgi:hypothetical protein
MNSRLAEGTWSVNRKFIIQPNVSAAKKATASCAAVNGYLARRILFVG